MSKSGQSLSFKYNAAGLRTEKTFNGTTTTYRWVGDKVTQEKNGTDTILYSYDAQGKLVSFSLNGTEYYYVRNGQGDITGILNGAGTQVVTYVYDSWGKLVSTTGTLASTVGVKNPYRYRGYRYDTETGLYYLQSRYYNPDWGRFLNADSQLNPGLGSVGMNMFAYCGNNPVNAVDPDGHAFMFITAGIGAVVGAIAGGLIAASQGKNILAGAAIGAVAGGLIGLGAGAVAGALLAGNATASTVASGGGQAAINGAQQISSKAAEFVSKGSSAVKHASNLVEQLALEQVRSMPELGEIAKKITLKDPRWPASEGWVKMQQIIHTSLGDINVHYVWNTVINVFDDFKLK